MWSYKHHDTMIQGWVRGLGIKFPEPQIGAWRLTCATSRYERQAALYSGLKYRISMLSRYWRWGKKINDFKSGLSWTIWDVQLLW